MFKQLFLFLEEPDDERFCKEIVVPILKQHFQEIKYVTYANMKRSKVENYLKSIASIPNANYIFLHDFDEHPCITKCKKTVLEEFSPALD